jgi:hypothetical protein
MMKILPSMVIGGALLLQTVRVPAAQGLYPGAGNLQPTLIRVTGFVSAAPQGITTLGPLTLGIGHKVQTLQLTAVQTLNGPLTEGPAALRHYWLYEPNVLLVGNAGLLKEIRSAPAQTKLTLFAYVEGSNSMLVVAVDRA